jgi:hypothetical protein
MELQIYSTSFHPQMDCINSCSATNSFEAITAAEIMIKILQSQAQSARKIVYCEKIISMGQQQRKL